MKVPVLYEMSAVKSAIYIGNEIPLFLSDRPVPVPFNRVLPPLVSIPDTGSIHLLSTCGVRIVSQ